MNNLLGSMIYRTHSSLLVRRLRPRFEPSRVTCFTWRFVYDLPIFYFDR